MRMDTARRIIGGERLRPGYMVSFEHLRGGILESDHFPDVAVGEPLIATEDEAWLLAAPALVAIGSLPAFATQCRFFGFIRSDLLRFLPYGAAKAWLKPEASEDEWTASPRDRDSVIKEIFDYMPFAWEKANGCRGLSAGRSLNHMQAWLWMLREEDAASGLDDYELYGKPQLRAICERFGWDWTQWDDGEWRNNDGDSGYPPQDAAPLRWAA